MPPKDNIDFDQNYLNEDEGKDFLDNVIEPDDFEGEASHPLNIDVQDDPDDDLTDDDIDDILGRSSNKRRMYIIAGVIVVTLISIWLFNRNGDEVAVDGDGGDGGETTEFVAASAEQDNEAELTEIADNTENLVADTVMPTMDLTEMKTIPADSLPAELQPHFETDTTLKSLDTSRKILHPLYEDFIATNRIPTMRLVTGALSDEELFSSSLEPDLEEFEWMLRVDLTKDEIIDTLPDSDEEFYLTLLEILQVIDAAPPANQEELNAMLYRSVEVEVDSVEIAQREFFVVHDTVVVNDPSVVAANDSLSIILQKLQKALTIAHEDIAGLQGEIKKFVKTVKTAEDSLRDFEVRKLARILSKMSPADAVARLEGRSIEELIELLFLLRQREAAKIIQELPPEKGQAVAAKIFRR